jgi:cyclohexanecarboxylate-CoA ligase
MRPTQLPDERIRAHELAGEWPHPSLSTVLRRRAAETPDRVYFIEGSRHGGRTFTFRDLDRRADRMAVALGRLGIGTGDVVAWQLPNWIEAPALAAAIDRVGAVSNPILTIYRERELGFACRRTGTKALVVPGEYRGTDHRELAAAVQADSPALEHVLTVRADPAAGQRALEALEDDPTEPLPPGGLGPHDVSAVFFTSGTTSDPKGVLHTPSTLGAVHRFHAMLLGGSADDRGLLQFPLTHIGGLVMFVLIPIANGSSLVCMDGFDPALAIELIERHGVTSAGGPPAVVQAMFACPAFTTEKMRSVRWVGAGAADVSPELMRTIGERMDAIAYRSYGLTECPMLTSGRRDDPEAVRYETDGRPVPGADVRIVDDAGRRVGAGVEGEIEAFGTQLCVGYLDPAMNDAFTTDGWLRTGDLAIQDASGAIRITGRRKDVIIRKGENLSAKGIEDELAEHPRIADVAVVGVPDAASGERVCACVVLRPGAEALDLDEVRAFMVARGVMKQKIPEQIDVLDVLPRNAMGKVRKDLLRARHRT